jgi:hypothetical protein
VKSATLNFRQIRWVFAGARAPGRRSAASIVQAKARRIWRVAKNRDPFHQGDIQTPVGAASRRRRAIEGSLIRKPTVNQVSGRIVLIAVVAIAVIIVVTTVAISAAAEAVIVANVGGVRLEAAALAEAASTEAALMEAASEAATASESAAAKPAASNKGAAASAAVAAASAAARISADRGKRQGANHEKSRKCSLDRWAHVSLSLPWYLMCSIELLSTRRHALNYWPRDGCRRISRKPATFQLKIIRRIWNFLELRANWEATKNIWIDVIASTVSNLGAGRCACVCSEARRRDGQRSGNTCCRNNFWLRRARPNLRFRNRLDEAKAPVAAILKMYPIMNIPEANAFCAMFRFKLYI